MEGKIYHGTLIKHGITELTQLQDAKFRIACEKEVRENQEGGIYVCQVEAAIYLEFILSILI